MSRDKRVKAIERRLLVPLFLIVAGLAAPGLAAEAITGQWEMTMDFGGRKMFATLTIAQKDDGSYTGKWGSEELSDVEFDGQKLSFALIRQMGDQEFVMEYAGTLKDGKLDGTMSNPRGDSPVSGARPKPQSPALGHWDMNFNVMDRPVKARISVFQKPDGTLGATWEEDFGQHTVKSVKFQDGKLTVDRTIKFEDQEFDATYVGKIEGNTLTGSMEGPMGEIQANGTRFGADLIGTWELTSTTDRGPRTRLLKVYPDLTGRYEFFGGEMPIELKLEGQQVSFNIEMGFGDRTFTMGFTGRLDGTTLSGEMTNPRGTNQITGKKVEKACPAVGTWQFTRQTDRGTFTSTLKIKDATSGTYTVRDNEVALDELTVDGDQVAFKVTLRFNDREMPLEFKGKVEGTALKGQWTTPRGTRDVEAKKMD